MAEPNVSALRPLYADSENNAHRSMPAGAKIAADIIPVSSDEGNALSVSSSGDGLFAPKTVATDIVSPRSPNYIQYDENNKIYLDGNSIASNGGSNLLTINSVDHKLEVTPDGVRSLIKVISDDNDNLIHPGTDGGAFVSVDDIIDVDGSKILFKDDNGKLDAGVTLKYDQASGTLNLVGHDGTTIVGTADIPTAASVLMGVEIVSGKPSSSGEAIPGDYHVSLAALYANEPDGGTGIHFKGATKGTGKETAFSYSLQNTAHADTWPGSFRAYFNGSTKEVSATTSSDPLDITFDDGSTLHVVWSAQVGVTLSGTATFTPNVGIQAGTFLHFTFRLANGVISDVYIDLTALTDVYTPGCGISIADRTVSIVTLNTGGLKCETGALAIKLAGADSGLATGTDGTKVVLDASGGLQTSTSGIGVKIDTDGGLVATADGVGVKVDPDGGLSTSTEGAAVKVDTDGGLAATVDGLGVKVDSDGGLETTVDGTGIKVDPNGGMQTTATGAGIKVDPDGGLKTGTAGAGIKVDPNGGMQTTATGAGVKVDPAGGLVVGPNGTGIDPDWLGEQVGTYETKLEAGNGVSLAPNEEDDATVISAKPNAAKAIEATADGIGVVVKADSGLSVTNGLNVVVGDGMQVGAGGVAVDASVVRTTGDQTVGGAKTFSAVVKGVTPANSAAGTELVTAAWIRANMASLIEAILSADEDNALTVGDDGKLKVVVVSKDTGNLLVEGSDRGAYTPFDYGTL